jgi:hypothetical protein
MTLSDYSRRCNLLHPIVGYLIIKHLRSGGKITVLSLTI